MNTIMEVLGSASTDSIQAFALFYFVIVYMFGGEAATLLDYVECYPDGFKSGTDLWKECPKITIEGFPVWVINGQSSFTVYRVVSDIFQIFSFRTSQAITGLSKNFALVSLREYDIIIHFLVSKPKVSRKVTKRGIDTSARGSEAISGEQVVNGGER